MSFLRFLFYDEDCRRRLRLEDPAVDLAAVVVVVIVVGFISTTLVAGLMLETLTPYRCARFLAGYELLVPFLADACPAGYLFDSAVLLLCALLPPPLALFSLHPFTAYAFLDDTVLVLPVLDDTLSPDLFDNKLGLT